MTFSEPITRVTGTPDPAKWKFRRNGAMLAPDSVFAIGGDLVFQAGMFDGLEIALIYYGPPPTYATFRWKALEAFDWWYWP